MAERTTRQRRSTSAPPAPAPPPAAAAESIAPRRRGTAERTVPACTSVNARAQAADIASRGPIVKQAIDAGQIAVVPAVYEIKTGKVSLL